MLRQKLTWMYFSLLNCYWATPWECVTVFQLLTIRKGQGKTRCCISIFRMCTRNCYSSYTVILAVRYLVVSQLTKSTLYQISPSTLCQISPSTLHQSHHPHVPKTRHPHLTRWSLSIWFCIFSRIGLVRFSIRTH